MISNEQVLDRLNAGREYMRQCAFKYERMSARYREMGGNPTNVQTDGRAGDQPVGQVNYPAINVRLKLASLVHTAPDFSVKCGTATNEEIVRAHLQEQWRSRHLLRTVRRIYQARLIGGLGFAAYLWGDGRFELEYVSPADLAIDPHTQDSTWNSVRWGGRKVRLPAWVAEERYPGLSLQAGKDHGKTAADRSDALEIWTYWDRDVEVETWQDKVLAVRRNPYQRVPVRVMQGDLDPKTEWALGDYDEITGVAELLKRLQNILNNAAQHGGGYAWADGLSMSEQSRDALLAGRHDQVIITNGMSGDKAMGWVDAMPLNPSLLEAMRMLQNGLDADQGVTGSQRGVITQSPRFATEAMMMQNSSGARGNVERSEIELFLSLLAEEQVRLTAQFGDPRALGPGVWEAYSDVTSVRVVEESAAWRDPAMDQQTSMQLLQSVAALAPVFMQMAQAGIAKKVPNLEAFVDDALRSFRRRNTDAYWLAVEAAAAAPGGDVGADGQMPADAGMGGQVA